MLETKLLTINPGSTSTKIAIFENEREVLSETINHSNTEIAKYHEIYDQFDFRHDLILDVLAKNQVELKSLTAIVARGGNMKPVRGGTYQVNDEMLKDLKIGVMGSHASNLGGGLAYAIAEEIGVKAYVVDPVIVDELNPLARFSGTPLINRFSKDHPLNQKAIGRLAAEKLGKTYAESNFVIAHLGGGISVAAHEQGKIIDVNNALNGDGPFSPERSGGLPFGSLIELCYSGKYEKAELMRKLVGHGGLVAYLGTNDGREISRRIEAGDQEARQVYEAMAYQIAKEIGAMSVVLAGKIDGILLTGGLAHDKLLMSWVSERVSFLAPVEIYPGEAEMEALNLGVRRVLAKEEAVQVYPN